jgi:hypothetical protein
MGIISLLFDKFTKSLEEVSTGKSFSTTVKPIEKTDYKFITKKAGYNFVWKKEIDSNTKYVCKLVINEDESLIQGLICFEDAFSFIEMHLVETAPHNFGKHKKYLGVLGNLVAYVCKISFENGYDGEVAFTAKSDLIKHYQDSLGAILIAKQKMYIPTLKAKEMVSLYYPNFFSI